MRDVWVTPGSRYGGRWVYTVMVDGKPYDHFDSTRWLTDSEMDDVAAGYREALP